jgi:hypothetical protein
MKLLSGFSAAIVTAGVMLFAGAAVACDYCDAGYGGRAVYSCNNALYDCRVESSYYTPRCDDGCGYRYGGRAHAYVHGYRHGYRDGFHDGYETASYDEDDRGFYDGDHHFRAWERWRDGDGHWRDGWHDDKGAWHDREARDDHHDGGHHDSDGHDGDHGGHDGGPHDDHHDGDHQP